MEKLFGKWNPENITIRVNSLARNFEKTVSLVEEMLFEPRWDEEQFNLAKSRIINQIKRNQANPSYLASNTLNKLIFGENNILTINVVGTEASVPTITIDDLKAFYAKYFSPVITQFLIVGNLNKQRVEAALAEINNRWHPKEFPVPEIKVPEPPVKSQIY